jgi:hypothetical protein
MLTRKLGGILNKGVICPPGALFAQKSWKDVGYYRQPLEEWRLFSICHRLCFIFVGKI